VIFVDSREPHDDVRAVLDAMGIETDVRLLNVSDFIVAGGIPILVDPSVLVTGKNGEVGVYVVERKTPQDFLQSLLTAHLNNQLYNMSTRYKHSVLAIEGGFRAMVDEAGVLPQTAYGALVGAFLRHSADGEQGSISVLQYESSWDLAMILERMQLKLNDKVGLTRKYMLQLPQTKKQSQDGDDDTQASDGDAVVKAVMCCPGIGEKTARAILAFYPTILHILTADPKEMAKTVPGVGEVTAKTVVRFFTEWKVGRPTLDRHR